MLLYIARRLLGSIPVLLGVSILVFSMLFLVPGDPVLILLGPNSEATKENIEQIREQMGLNQPIPVQYLNFLGKAVQGDLGRSVRTKQPVTQAIAEAFPNTLALTLSGLGLAILIGTTLGLLAAVNQNTFIDGISMVLALIGVSMPSFWLGLLLIFFFSFTLGLFPATGGQGLERLILPAVTLGVIASGIIARLVRSSMLEVLRQEYVTTARAKGLANLAVITRHALRNALIPVVTIVGLQFGTLLGGAVVIETVFSRPGIGRMAVQAILDKDFPIVQGCVLLASVCYVTANLLVDISYAILDPRIRYS